jgi:hypothetical protein
MHHESEPCAERGVARDEWGPNSGQEN